MRDVPIISVVDDDASVRMATESLVRSLGFSARTFASAREFLDSPYVDSSACVIADVTMPGMSGIDMQSALIEQGCRLPIIFMTAFPEERARQRALNAGAVGFLGKPCDCRSIIECLDMVLDKASTRQGANASGVPCSTA